LYIKTTQFICFICLMPLATTSYGQTSLQPIMFQKWFSHQYFYGSSRSYQATVEVSARWWSVDGGNGGGGGGGDYSL
jgi:hypothetical protein